jgi:hypothetical protein
MKPPFPLLCLFALLMALGCAEEELMFFADDHYKAICEPMLKASAINPFLEQGNNSTLRIALANVGLAQELIPNRPGENNTEVSSEAREELHDADAVNIIAKLSSSGSVVVTSEPHRLDFLPRGGLALLNFDLRASEVAEGWYSLLLDLEYEHQTDVKAINGSISSLYRPANASQKISVLVQDSDQSFKAEGASSDLYPGANGTIMAVIKNTGWSMAKNCSARLLASPPFRSASLRLNLGDILPGQATVAKLPATVDGKAEVREYRLACEIVHENQTAIVFIPVLLVNRPSLFPGSYLIIGVVILALGLIALQMFKRGPGRRVTLRSFRRWKRWL